MSGPEDSDYVVEHYVKPETVRHTYKKDEDLISGSEDEKSESISEDESEKNAQSVENNDEVVDEPEEIARPNNRFILYVTNLSSETKKKVLEDYFGDCGRVKNVRIPKVRLGCYAFVEMMDIAGFKVKKRVHVDPFITSISSIFRLV